MVTTQRSPFRSDALRNKVVLVTGGGSGIGYEITKQLLVHGCAGAVICGRREPFLRRSSHLLSTETGQPCSYQVCDVRQPPQCRDAVAYAVQHFGQLDLVVNCAAGNFLAQAKELSPKGFATVLAIDTLGTYNVSVVIFISTELTKTCTQFLTTNTITAYTIRQLEQIYFKGIVLLNFFFFLGFVLPIPPLPKITAK